MRILQVVHGFPPENIAGTEVYAYNLAKALSKNNEVFIFYRVNRLAEEEYFLSRQERDGLTIFSINNAFRKYESFVDTYNNPKIEEKFVSVLLEVKPDLVHVQHMLYLGAGIVEQAKKRGIPVVFTLNDFWSICPQGQLFNNNSQVCTFADSSKCVKCVFYQLNIGKNIFNIHYFIKSVLPSSFYHFVKRAYFWFYKKSSKKTAQGRSFIEERVCYFEKILSSINYFIAPSKFIKDRFVAYGILADKILYFKYGFCAENFKMKPKSLAKKMRFGFIGNLMPAKGVHVVIQAFNSIGNQNAELKIYGKAVSYKSLLTDYPKQLRKLALKNRYINFMGGFDNSSISDIFSEIDVLVVPSIWYENAPLVIQEAFLAKTPVIASRIGGIPELVRDGENGFLFEPGDALDLASKIMKFIDNPGILNEFNFSATQVMDMKDHSVEMERIYAGLVKGTT